LAWIRSLTLATGIPNGSPELEHEFAERFLPRLQTFFRARLPNSTLTEELTQDTLVAALLALRAGKLRNPQALEPFVLGIARNHLAEALRLQGKHHPTAGDAVEHLSSSPELAPEWRLTVQQHLETLPPTDQSILRLIILEGFRPAEVAPQVGLSEEAVRQRKSRLLRLLHEKLFPSPVTDVPKLTTLPPRSTPDPKP
jgi:RNA polymerase sigma factor (sigma-70 family)